MKTIIFLILIFTSACSQKSAASEIVDLQIEAYNKRDINAFAKTYHDSVEVYYFPNNLKYKGKNNLIKNYKPMFNKVKKLNAKIIRRVILNNKVIDLEEASFYYENTKMPDSKVRVLVTYEVVDGLITKVQFTQ